MGNGHSEALLDQYLTADLPSLLGVNVGNGVDRLGVQPLQRIAGGHAIGASAAEDHDHAVSLLGAVVAVGRPAAVGVAPAAVLQGVEVAGEEVAQGAVLVAHPLHPGEDLLGGLGAVGAVGPPPAAHVGGGVGAAGGVGVPGLLAHAARAGNQTVVAEHLGLDGVGVQIGLAEGVGAPDGDGSPQGLGVDAAAARGAVVDDQIGVFRPQIVPQAVEVHDVLDLVEAPAVHLVGDAPGLERLHVEVLTEALDVQLVDEAADHLKEVLPHLVLLQTEEEVEAVQGIQPVGMLHRQIGPGVSPLGLHPEEELHAHVVNRPDHVLQPVGVLVGADLPVAHLLVPVTRAGGAALAVPARVDPVVVGLDAVLAVLVQVVQVPLGGHAHALQGEGKLIGGEGTQLILDETAELIATLHTGALKFHQKNGGGADPLTGMKLEGGVFQTALDLQGVPLGVGEFGVPLARPADDGHETAAGGVELKEGHLTAGGASPHGMEGAGGTQTQLGLVNLALLGDAVGVQVGLVARTAVGVVEGEGRGLARGTREAPGGVAVQNIRDQTAVVLPPVLEPQVPGDGVVGGELLNVQLHPQAVGVLVEAAVVGGGHGDVSQVEGLFSVLEREIRNGMHRRLPFRVSVVYCTG